jgi:hypothetical protein
MTVAADDKAKNPTSFDGDIAAVQVALDSYERQ